MSLRDECVIALEQFVSERRANGATVHQVRDRKLPEEVIVAYAFSDNTFFDVVEVVPDRCYALVVSEDAPKHVWVCQVKPDLVDGFCLAHDTLELHAASSCQAGRALMLKILENPSELLAELKQYTSC
ncbi:MAG TPA: hypothetical protein VD907_00420 [Verrucomicrobiae bacterium]|nr:hypothetical protein [Verrucomicrobiae bacterium]